MKSFVNEITYNDPPIHTLIQLHKKYPNPYATHVVSVDTVERSLDPSGLIRTERVIGVKQSAPGWIAKLFALPPIAYVREVVFIDPDAPSATMMSMNLDLAQYVSCLERITYTPTEEGNTLFHQRAALISAFPTAMIARRIEKASVDRFRSNADTGRKGFEWVLAQGYKRDSDRDAA